jgi:hypothetical protein
VVNASLCGMSGAAIRLPMPCMRRRRLRVAAIHLSVSRAHVVVQARAGGVAAAALGARVAVHAGVLLLVPLQVPLVRVHGTAQRARKPPAAATATALQHARTPRQLLATTPPSGKYKVKPLVRRAR